ncbi:MAG: hypothetical protein AAFZ15_16840 [Bacteroidota bacterium]
MKNTVLRLNIGVALLLSMVFSWPLLAGEPVAEKSIFDLMNYREVLDLTLEADLATFKVDRQNTSSHPAKISFKDVSGEPQEWDLKIKLRGAFRRMKCTDVPPLKLNFKKSELEKAGLAKFDDLKLVPQCFADQAAAKESLLKEYLAYKLYNEMSGYSFRVQLVRITYVDITTGQKDKQWAFLIEDAAQLRARLHAEKMEDKYNLPVDSFHLSQARLMAVFEYLIGNGDWSFRNLKNVKFMRKKGKVIPVPYDFDFSGMVNAAYAIPNVSVGQTSVQERVFLGFENDPGLLHSTIYHVLGKQEKLEAIVLGFKPLSYSSRLEVLEYLRDFFESPEQIKMMDLTVVSESRENPSDR